MDKRVGHSSFAPRYAALTSSLRALLGERLLALIHFGSTARGSEKSHVEFTDIDVLVVVQCLPNELKGFISTVARLDSAEIKEALYQLEMQSSGCKRELSLVVKTSEDLKPNKSFSFELAHDGVVIFDPSQWVRDFFLRTESYIAENGIVRKEIGLKWYWTGIKGSSNPSVK